MAAAEELKQLGRYDLVSVLGKGAMGIVYEGLDPRRNRKVAIKTILKGHIDDEAASKEYSMRFMREAQSVARLNHPNIVQVYDFGEQGDIAYIVMEYIKGKELKSFFDANERFELKESVRIMCELLDALDFAHEAGVIHRDVKPANVMIDSQGRVKLTDFGVARVQDGAEQSQAGTMVGTPAYMSPEQITGGNIDRRSDVFSAGIILYQFLAGEKPFTGSGAWTIAKKIIQDHPPVPSSINNTISPLFDAVVNKALSKSVETRYQTAKEFAQALKRAIEGKADEDDYDKTVVGSMADMGALEGRVQEDGALEQEWWYADGNVKTGPLPLSDLLQRLGDNRINLDTFVWRPGWKEWRKIADVMEIRNQVLVVLAEQRRRVPPPLPTSSAFQSASVSAKSASAVTAAAGRGNISLHSKFNSWVALLFLLAVFKVLSDVLSRLAAKWLQTNNFEAANVAMVGAVAGVFAAFVVTVMVGRLLAGIIPLWPPLSGILMTRGTAEITRGERIFITAALLILTPVVLVTGGIVAEKLKPPSMAGVEIVPGTERDILIDMAPQPPLVSNVVSPDPFRAPPVSLSLDDEVTISMACGNLQLAGDVSAYRNCIRQQSDSAASLPSLPNFSDLPLGEQIAMKMACGNYQLNGILEYRACILRQLRSIGR
ncbi:MAG: hypothetical protein A3G41_05915 [Elusimicrobia bacterium RIFCSPLOWO2_12_FULL_59_9]|nr:MAG: hypothetical protein A3G41_05915 [Elusimicrobia bacterium RIFCSPLOWO2_12_FULL_59_9]